VLVLLIASANAANLLLSRSLSRTRELAVRAALGASRSRLMRHVLADGLVLAVTGGSLGVALAFWSTRVVIPWLPAALPRGTDLRINPDVLAFAVFASMTAALLAAAVPALAALRSNANLALRESGRGVKIGGHPAQQTFVVAQVALTMVLLVGAGLLGRTLMNLLDVDPGFRAEHVTAFYTGVASSQGKTPEQIRQRFRAIESRVAAVSGVESASVEFGALPLTGNTQFSVLPADVAVPPERAADGYPALFYATGPAYFRTMGIALRRGRAFTRDDDSRHPSVAIVDEELARQIFPGQDAVGKRLRLLAGEQPLMEVVGVAGHVKHWGLDADRTAGVRGQLYIPYMQLPDPFTSYAGRVTTVIVRSNDPSARIVSAIRKELAAYDADQAVHHERRMKDVVLQSLDNRRFVLLLLGIFGVVALLLAIVGLYGVMSYAVTQRTPEFGVRMALGARTGQMLRHIVTRGQVVALKGIVVGTIGGVVASRMLGTLLYGVGPADPLTFIVVGVIVCGVAFLACVLPARRAARVDPVVALRSE